MLSVGVGVVLLAGLVFWLSSQLSGTASGGPTVLHGQSVDYSLQVSVANPRMGSTPVDITVTDRAGHPATPSAVSIEPVMPAMGHATSPVAATSTAGGHFHADVPLPMTGQWELTIALSGPAGAEHIVLPLTVTG
jgi:hypothetical protein